MQTKFSILILLALTLVISSCSKDDNDPDVLQAKINNVIPPEFVQTVKGLGMDVYSGDTPPDITGSYVMNPNLLLRSNITNDVPSNTQFVNYGIRFSNQNLSEFTISFVGTASGERDEGSGAIITGSGNNFTVYGKSTTTVGSNSVVLGVMYSGTLEDGKIKNLKRAIVAIDDRNSGTSLLKNGNARVFHDGDKSS